jgi:hypothetical protein
MAYNRRYESKYFSLNGRQYYLEIRDQNFTGTTKTCSLGAGGCKISYDTDSDSRYTPIIASKMEIPFIVKDAVDQVFIKQLIENSNEEDIVVALYIGGSAQYPPLFSGYLLTDLGAQEDVSFPYEVKLTATDGLARLKDIGFWSDEATNLTYKHKGQERITYWIKEILNKITPPGTTQGITSDVRIRAAVNWYNEQHANAGMTFGPLHQTKIKMGMMEEVDADGNIIVRNSYDVLKSLCITFGMRCIYWKHKYHFIQIDGYNTAESGTLINPENINTRDYDLSGAHIASNDFLGSTYWSRYNQVIENQTNPGKGIQKLAGTTFENYPILKKVSGDFINFGSENYYNGFPESTPGPNSTGGVGNIVSVSQLIMEDPQVATKFLLKIPLSFQQDTSVASYNTAFNDFTVNFDCYIKASIPSGATGTGSTQYLYSNGSGGYAWSTTLPAVGDFIRLSSPVFSNSGGMATLTPHSSPSGEMPAITGVTGTWQFEIILQAFASNGSFKDPVKIKGFTGTFSTSANGIDYNIHGVKWKNQLNAAPGTWTNQVVAQPNGVNTQTLVYNGTGNPYAGQLYLLNSSFSVGALGSKVISQTNTNDTSEIYLGPLNWGDSALGSDASAIQVWNGSAWVFTDPSGDWGIGTITPSTPLSLTKLLLEQYLEGQNSSIYRMNARIVLGRHERYQNDGSGSRPKYINPIGRLVHPDGTFPSKNYIFLRGSFTTGEDEWDGEWFNIERQSPTITTTTTNLNSLTSPIGGTTHPNASNTSSPSATLSPKMAAPAVIATTTAVLSAQNKVANGQFTADSDWSKSSGVTISSSQLKFASVASGQGALSVSSAITLGKQYEVQFTVSGYSSGGVYVQLGATAGTTVTANGDYTQSITPETSTTIQILASAAGTTLDIDGIILVEKITSIPINDIGETLLADNDRIYLINNQSGEIYNLRLNAAQSSGDTSLTIDAFAFDEDVPVGALLGINQRNLIQQYQNKTEGTIGGMAVTSTTIDGAGKVGREVVSFRCEGNNISSGNYYISEGEDNNKSGRWSEINPDAPSQIGTQRALKGSRLLLDNDCKIESGRVAISGSSTDNLTVTLYKVSPTDNASAALTQTSIGTVTLTMNGNAKPRLGTFSSLSAATISAGDIIVPTISVTGTTSFRGVITFTLIYE